MASENSEFSTSTETYVQDGTASRELRSVTRLIPPLQNVLDAARGQTFASLDDGRVGLLVGDVSDPERSENPCELWVFEKAAEDIQHSANDEQSEPDSEQAGLASSLYDKIDDTDEQALGIDTGALQPVLEFTVFQALFDKIEKLFVQNSLREATKKVRQKAAHGYLIKAYAEMFASGRYSHMAATSEFELSEQYRILISVAINAMKGLITSATRQEFGRLFYRERYDEFSPLYPSESKNKVDLPTPKWLDISQTPHKREKERTVVSDDNIQSKFADATSNKEIGAMLKAARKEAGLTQSQVGERMAAGKRDAAIPQSNIARLERGDAGASREYIADYLKAVGAKAVISYERLEV